MTSPHSKTHFHHPGIILRDLYLAEMGFSQTTVAKATGIPQSRLSEICAGRRSISADTALRLGKFFDVDPQGFINLQAHYDFEEAKTAFEAKRPREKIIPYSQLQVA